MQNFFLLYKSFIFRDKFAVKHYVTEIVGVKPRFDNMSADRRFQVVFEFENGFSFVVNTPVYNKLVYTFYSAVDYYNN